MEISEKEAKSMQQPHEYMTGKFTVLVQTLQ